MTDDWLRWLAPWAFAFSLVRLFERKGLRLATRPLLIGLLIAGCGSSVSAIGATCTILNDYEIEWLRTVAIETDLAEVKPPGSAFTVRNVRIIRQDIFPVARHLLARQANRFHPRTKDRVVLAALPFAIDDVIDEPILKEAERILRAKPFFYDVRVFVRQICDGEADIDIVARDVWTLTPRLSFNRAGGDNEFVVGLRDSNFLGLGKDVVIAYEDDDDRTGINLGLSDPNVFGSRWAARAFLADNDDGHLYTLSVSKPFFALDTRFATGIALSDNERDDGLYLLNEKIWEIGVESEAARAFVGFSKGRQGRWVDRLMFGAAYQNDEFVYPLGFPDPGAAERRFVYPFVAWQRIEDRFVNRSNVDRVGRTEDIGLGIRSYVELGWSADAFGGIGDYLIGRAILSGRWYLADRHLMNVELGFSGRYEVDDHFTDEAVLSLGATYLWQHRDQWSFLVSANYTEVHNPPDHRQLTIGGDSDLRGYPSRYQIGDRRYLFTLEERYYTKLEPFGLFRLGWAAFVDIGRAWYEDTAPAWVPAREGDHFDRLVNIGVGLRVESIRTRGDRVFHIDIAKPLTEGPGIDSYEITLTGKRSI